MLFKSTVLGLETAAADLEVTVLARLGDRLAFEVAKNLKRSSRFFKGPALKPVGILDDDVEAEVCLLYAQVSLVLVLWGERETYQGSVHHTAGRGIGFKKRQKKKNRPTSRVKRANGRKRIPKKERPTLRRLCHIANPFRPGMRTSF